MDGYVLVFLDAYDHIPNRAIFFPGEFGEEMGWDFYERHYDGCMAVLVPVSHYTKDPKHG